MIGYYVSVIDGPRKGFLLGPYDTHAEALENVDRGRELALKTDNASRTWFYSYGTCRIERDGKLPKGVFGS